MKGVSKMLMRGCISFNRQPTLLLCFGPLSPSSTQLLPQGRGPSPAFLQGKQRVPCQVLFRAVGELGGGGLFLSLGAPFKSVLYL